MRRFAVDFLAALNASAPATMVSTVITVRNNFTYFINKVFFDKKAKSSS
jgi:hypothetical protein